MTVGQASDPAVRATRNSEVLLDGLFTGMIGALIVAVWFLILDVAAGRPLYTPALLGTVLLHGAAVAANGPIIAPLEIAAYTAVHFIAFVVVGIVFSELMNLFERFPIMFFVLLVLFLSLQLGVFVADAALGTQIIGRLAPWSVLIANLLAAAGMAWYQWLRHPSVLKSVDRLWEHDLQ